jgi:hypothetical protein
MYDQKIEDFLVVTPHFRAMGAGSGVFSPRMSPKKQIKHP